MTAADFSSLCQGAALLEDGAARLEDGPARLAR